jgi:N-acetylglutamate synthase-like GNAT family acetyltransferase
MRVGRRAGEVVATGGVMEHGAVVRNKNLVVHPAHRRSTVGLAMLSHLAADARTTGRYVGTFAVAGDSGERLYLAAGMEPVVVQREWSRPL